MRRYRLPWAFLVLALLPWLAMAAPSVQFPVGTTVGGTPVPDLTCNVEDGFACLEDLVLPLGIMPTPRLLVAEPAAGSCLGPKDLMVLPIDGGLRVWGCEEAAGNPLEVGGRPGINQVVDGASTAVTIAPAAPDGNLNFKGCYHTSGSVAPNVELFCGPHIDVRDYGVVMNSAADQTTELQAAFLAAYSTNIGRLYIPAGSVKFSQIKVRPGVSVQCAGMRGTPGTELIQLDGVDISAIVVDDAIVPATEYLHWFSMSDCKITKEGEAAATDTLGSGFELNARTGEGFKLSRLNVTHFPEDGIRLRRGGTTPMLDDLHVFSNGAYGLSLIREGADTWQTVTVNGLSGDNNATALLRIKTAGGSSETFNITNTKAETRVAGAQLNVIELEDTNGASIVVANLGANAGNSVTGNAIFRIIGTSGPRLTLIGVKSDTNYTYGIDDVFFGRTVPAFSSPPMLAWYASVAGGYGSVHSGGINFGGGANPRVRLDHDSSSISFGDGTAAVDTTLSRGAAGRLEGLNIRALGMFSSAVQTVTCTDNGSGTQQSVSLQPTSTFLAVTNSDPHGCLLTFIETSAQSGYCGFLVVITNAGGTVNIADTAGVTETAGALALDVGDAVGFGYTNSRFYQLTPVVNN